MHRIVPHAVVDPTFVRRPLDLLAACVYAVVLGGCAFATRRRPAIGAALLLALAPFGFARYLGATTLSLPKLALLGLLAGLAARRIDPRPALAAARPLVLGALALVAANALSIVVAHDRGAAVRETLKACEYALAFGATAIALRADPDRAAAALRIALTVSCGLVALLAIDELRTGAPSGFWIRDVPLPRIAGPLEGPNQLAGYLGVAIPVLVALVGTRRARAGELLALSLGGAALVLSVSRAGILATLLAAAGVLVVSARGGREVASAAGALALGVLAGLLGVAWEGAALLHGARGALAALGRLWSTAGDAHHGGVGTRGELWRAARDLWRRSPLLGIGAGNFEEEIALVGPSGVRTHANDVYLQALVEGGAPLFLATVATLLAPLVRFARTCAADPLRLGVLAATAALAAHELVDDLTYFPKIGEPWWILVGAAASSRRGSPVQGSSNPDGARKPTTPRMRVETMRRPGRPPGGSPAS